MRAIVGVALAASVMSLPGLTGPASAATPATGTVIATSTTAFGTALVVGSGKYAGYSLYFITSDHGTTFGCSSSPVTTPVGKILCAGPSGDKNAEWPAITTTAAPIAGAGVSQSLLGTVERSFGEQVTYAGHPLYLFDRGPGQVTGEGWDEPGLPPWHGIWDLLAPSGQALPWAGTLSTVNIGNETFLAMQMMTAVGWENFPVYSYSKDTSSHSACSTGGCARAWPAVLTSGTPGVSNGLSAAKVGTLATPAGSQVSYDGMPLYFFAHESIALTAAGFSPTGNGNRTPVGGGIFNLVAP